MWRKEDCQRVGSLVLGTGLAQQGEQTAAEKRKYAKIWQIRINKDVRRVQDRHEAEDMLKEAANMNYETMFMKGNKESAEALQAADKKAKGKDPKKDKKKKNFDDEQEQPNVSDDQILQGILEKKKWFIFRY